MENIRFMRVSLGDERGDERGDECTLYLPQSHRSAMLLNTSFPEDDQDTLRAIVEKQHYTFLGAGKVTDPKVIAAHPDAKFAIYFIDTPGTEIIASAKWRCRKRGKKLAKVWIVDESKTVAGKILVVLSNKDDEPFVRAEKNDAGFTIPSELIL